MGETRKLLDLNDEVGRLDGEDLPSLKLDPQSLVSITENLPQIYHLMVIFYVSVEKTGKVSKH